MKDEYSNVQASAARALGGLGKPSVEPLVQALEDGDSNVQACAAQALGKIRDARAVEPLVQALEDGDSNVQESAAQALGGIGDTRAVEALLQASKDGHWGATEVLGNRGDARAVEPLIQALKDENRDIGESAANILGKIGDARAVEALLQASKYGNSDARESAAKALVGMGDLRVAETIIDYLISEPFRYHQIDKSNYFGNYTDIILRAFGSSSDVHNDGDDIGRRPRYDLQKSVEAVGELCNIRTQISNNILHKISKRKDVAVSVSWGCECGSIGLSFEPQRMMARGELCRRGNPPYDPSVYLNKEAWKL